MNGSLLLFMLVLLGLLILKYQKRKRRVKAVAKELPDKSTNFPYTVLITGGNSGIGRECARQLTLLGCNVVIACRNETKAREAIQSIEKEVELENREREETSKTLGVIRFKKLDLKSKNSINNFIENWGDRKIDAIVCNAGIKLSNSSGSAVRHDNTVELTNDGIELTFGVNHLGHFQLVTGLMKNITNTARIVVVSSNSHIPRWIPWVSPEDLRLRLNEPAFIHELVKPVYADPWTCYTRSKLCNVLFAYELSRRIREEDENSGITVNAVSPGFIPNSGIASDYPPFLRGFIKKVVPLFRYVTGFVRSLEEGGMSLSNLVLNPKYNDITEKYFYKFDEYTSSVDSSDPLLARRLWELSENLIKEVA